MDERQIELECLASIFPEIQIDPRDPFTARIEIPVHPASSIDVRFFATSIRTHSTALEYIVNSNFEPSKLSYLPSLNVCITLPEGYPLDLPPDVNLTTNPKWISDTVLDELKGEAQILWKESGGSIVLYAIIDSLQQSAENVFGYSEKEKILEVPEELKISLLDFNVDQIHKAFKNKTFNCGICLEPKKGALCHQMLDCHHVFCVKCLQDFYVNAILNGDLVSVRCLAPDCVKNSKENQSEFPKKKRRLKTLRPIELLQIPLEQDMVTRYVKLMRKLELESDKNTVYCPRKWCGGAARTSKPSGSDDMSEESDSQNGTQDERKELLSICEDCSFAFCGRCFQSWHGDFILCAPRVTGELTEEEKASQEYLKLHTTQCPTCTVPCQKSHGCNHMICSNCNTHFCYLCSSWLSPDNPYKHYNTQTTGCYMRLWELEEGDTDDDRPGFLDRLREVDQIDEILMPEVEIPAVVIPQAVEPPSISENDTELADPILPDIEREGPLVLRINYLPQTVKAHVVLDPKLTQPQPKTTDRGFRLRTRPPLKNA
ncbi:E3 ubiquitin-protein ligase itt1 [Golovinomyces cichoracearum]|uniref:RBR-type E3 ubiquitin transferase n=1 Tax=Golovinomyces cichoracearum TaxID=62708 RepID=A0A420IL05_9PEZI|nr:E3 ubiquitin-protein ligase itt1 [Golovinomyces cichoracearum]